jgi:hypothetical protein
MEALMASQQRKFEHGTGVAAADMPAIVSNLLAGQRDVIEANRRMVLEALHFTVKRIDAQRNYFARLAEAKNAEELRRLNAEFWNDAAADLAGEFKIVAQSVQDMVDSLNPTERRRHS